MSQHIIAEQCRHFLRHLQKRCVDTAQIPCADKTLRLVDRHPVLHPVRECIDDNAGVFREKIADPLRFPAAHLIRPHGQVPVIQRHQRLDPGAEELVDQIAVELNSLRIDDALGGHYARPADREAVGLQADLLHQRHILFVMMIMVGRDSGILISFYMSFIKRIPDAGNLPVFCGCSLYLIRRRRGAP